MDVPTVTFGKCVDTIEGMLVGRGHGSTGPIQMDDLEEEPGQEETMMPAAHAGGEFGKAGVEGVLVEKLNFLGEEILGRRRKGEHTEIAVDENSVAEWDKGNSVVKRRKM